MIWELSLSTSIASKLPLLEALAPVREAGFTRIQVAPAPGHLDFHDAALVAAVGREAAALRLTVTSANAPFGPGADLSSLDEGERRAAVGEVEATAEALASLGGKILVVHAGSEDEKARVSAAARLRQSARSLASLQTTCRDLGVTLAIEDMLGHLLGGTTEDLQRVFDLLATDGHSVATCLDTGHSFLSGRLAERTLLMAPRAVMVHAHDNRGTYDDHLPPGEGKLMWAPFLDNLASLPQCWM